MLISAIAAIALVAAPAIAGDQNLSPTPIIVLPPQAIVTPSPTVPEPAGPIEKPVHSANACTPDIEFPPGVSPLIACQGNSPIRHRSRRDEPPPESVA